MIQSLLYEDNAHFYSEVTTMIQFLLYEDNTHFYSEHHDSVSDVRG